MLILNFWAPLMSDTSASDVSVEFVPGGAMSKLVFGCTPPFLDVSFSPPGPIIVTVGSDDRDFDFSCLMSGIEISFHEGTQ